MEGFRCDCSDPLEPWGLWGPRARSLQPLTEQAPSWRCPCPAVLHASSSAAACERATREIPEMRRRMLAVVAGERGRGFLADEVSRWLGVLSTSC